MQLQAHFCNIQKVIVEHLENTQSEILVAVAWFTDREIFEVLCQKARAGVHISIALLGDDINKAPSGLNFNQLRSLGGKVRFLPEGINGTPMMHHKFCVLDELTVITGSYNWSKKAQINDENITVVTNAPDFATEYRQAFNKLVFGSDPQEKIASTQVPSEAIRRRLDMIRNLIFMYEEEALRLHIHKLLPLVREMGIQSLMSALEQGDYTAALAAIAVYLKDRRDLVTGEDVDIPNLQFQLKTLELRLQSLSDEKSDLERTLIVFNRRYTDALGILIIDLLGLKAKLAKRKAEASQRESDKSQLDKKEAEQEKQQAEQDWYDYRNEYEQQQVQDTPSQLNEEEEAEFKKLYRKICSLCHPDRFEDTQKEAAHQVFITLQELYKANDISAMRELHYTLKSEGLSKAPRSSTLSRSDALRAAIAELQHRISETLRQLQHLHHSEGADLLRLAGKSESDWLVFFEKQKQLLQEEILQLQHAITLYDTDNAE